MKEQCLAAKPAEETYKPPPVAAPSQVAPSVVDELPGGEQPVTSPTAAVSSSDAFTPPDQNDEGAAFIFSPVTGSFTCKSAGLSCTIKCSQCESIKRVSSGMLQDAPNEYTLVYTAEFGTEDHPDEPSRLILVEYDELAANAIACDKGCSCDSVNDAVLGCGLIPKPTEVQYNPIAPFPSQPPAISSSFHASILSAQSILLVFTMLMFR